MLRRAMALRSAATPRDRLETWGRFTATTFGGLAAMVVFTTRASIWAGQLEALGAIALLVAIGVAEGALLGALQWSALAGFADADDRAEWIATTAIGVALAWLLALATGVLAPRVLDLGSAGVGVAALAGGALIGALIGALQWWVLARHFSGALAWLRASALGWCLSVVPVFVATPEILAGTARGVDALTTILVGLLCAGLGAAVIGTALEAVVRRARPT
jgi:hypothetical protein